MINVLIVASRAYIKILNPPYCFPKVPYSIAGDAVVEVGGSYGLRKSPIVVASEMQMPEAHAAASFSALAGNISTAAASMLPGIASMQKLFTTDGRELRATLAAHTTFKASRGTTGVSGLLPETSELAGPPQLKRLHHTSMYLMAAIQEKEARMCRFSALNLRQTLLASHLRQSLCRKPPLKHHPPLKEVI